MVALLPLSSRAQRGTFPEAQRSLGLRPRDDNATRIGEIPQNDAFRGSAARGDARGLRGVGPGVGSGVDADLRPHPVDRLLHGRLRAGRAGPAARRAGLRGDPHQPQPQLGPARHARLHQDLVGKGSRRGPGATLYRRYRPAAGRPRALGPCQPPDRPRCRHLVRAPARPAAGAGATREPATALARPANDSGIDDSVFTPQHVSLLRLAAEMPHSTASS